MTQAELQRKREQRIAETKADYERLGYDWDHNTGVITRRKAKIKGKAAVKAHKRARQAARRLVAKRA